MRCKHQQLCVCPHPASALAQSAQVRLAGSSSSRFRAARYRRFSSMLQGRQRGRGEEGRTCVRVGSLLLQQNMSEEQAGRRSAELRAPLQQPLPGSQQHRHLLMSMRRNSLSAPDALGFSCLP